MTRESVRVAVPWSLSHYIPLNGFHPLYRALFDHAPQNVTLHAWDNVKLCKRFSSDTGIRNAVLHAAFRQKHKNGKLGEGTLANAYQEHLWPPNQILTEQLIGDVEFHHTAPFPSRTRPFVFHCESFAPVFLPFAGQGSGAFSKHEELREHYRQLFADPLCLGIFSHIPETLSNLRLFFGDDAIDRKLFGSRIGLSEISINSVDLSKRSSRGRPRFLFVNSAHQNPDNFFRRGGHIVLRFWHELMRNGRDGILMLRCARPSDKDLENYGVDTSFVSAETGRSIQWGEDYLANHEMNALMASADFFLLPSLSLHSVSIMHAMRMGAVPVVTDTIGTSVYVQDEVSGIVLQGVREVLWHIDPNTGILFDSYCHNTALDESLVTQLTRRILALLDAPQAYRELQSRLSSLAIRQFSGEVFSDQFWGASVELLQQHRSADSHRSALPAETAQTLEDCTLQNSDWSRVFESVTQPMRRIYTGQSTVFELGGALVHVHDNPRMRLHDWSPLAQYYVTDAPQTTFAVALTEFGGKYLTSREVLRERGYSWLGRKVSMALMPFPELHSLVASAARNLRRRRKYLAKKFGKSDRVADVELALHGVSGYNIIRYFHKYYAIPQAEGAFDPDKATTGGYSSHFCASSIEGVLRKVSAANRKSNPKSPAPTESPPELVVEGFHGFNIIRFRGEFHAIPQGEGKFKYAKVVAKKYTRCFSAGTAEDAQRMILSSIAPQSATREGVSS